MATRIACLTLPGFPLQAAFAVLSEGRIVASSLGEALLQLSPTVDLDPRGAAYVAVPEGHAGHAFAEKLLETARRQGLRGRAGVADDRFTAWAATQALPHQDVRVVPPHGSARFLASLP